MRAKILVAVVGGMLIGALGASSTGLLRDNLYVRYPVLGDEPYVERQKAMLAAGCEQVGDARGYYRCPRFYWR